MSISDLLEAIGLRAKKQAAEKAQSFAALCRLVAREKPVDPDDAAAVLQAAGKSAEDLQGEVNRILERRRLREIIAKHAAWHHEVAAVGIARAESRLERDRILSPWSSAARAIDQREVDITRAELQLDAARRRLVELGDGSPEEALEDLRAQVEERRAEIGCLRAAIARKSPADDALPPGALPALWEPLSVKIGRAKTYLADLAEESPERQRYREHLAMLEAALASRKTRLEVAERELAALEAQAKAVEAP
ncbi:MAG: hypothetical protein ACYC35_27555 [Pirellulales bacterium]